MHDVWTEIIQTADLSWDIRMKWFGQDVLLSAFASASEALAELMSLYPQLHIRIEVVPFNSVKEPASA